MTSCRSCGQMIVWVVTEAKEGKPSRKMPLDADPETGKAARFSDGNIVPVKRRDDGQWEVRYVGKGPNRCRSHFATCPDANHHRRAR